MPPDVKLYTYALSPYGMKVYWALVFKGIRFSIDYVNPATKASIAFTNHKVVPVVQIDDEWRLDSGPICCWLDERFSDRPVAGADRDEKEAIAAADQWVSDNVIGLSFRSIIDDESFFSAFRNGRILANTMRKTTQGIPWWAQFVWYKRMRNTQFLVSDANKVNRSVSMAECRAGIVEQLDAKLQKTGYVAGTNSPSYADLSIFAQLMCNTTLGFEGALLAKSSPLIEEFYGSMCGYLNLAQAPSLVPGWQPLFLPQPGSESVDK